MVSADSAKPVRLFMSYARGKETTPVARSIKRFLEQNAFSVWMDWRFGRIGRSPGEVCTGWTYYIVNLLQNDPLCSVGSTYFAHFLVPYSFMRVKIMLEGVHWPTKVWKINTNFIYSKLHFMDYSQNCFSIEKKGVFL